MDVLYFHLFFSSKKTEEASVFSNIQNAFLLEKFDFFFFSDFCISFIVMRHLVFFFLVVSFE